LTKSRLSPKTRGVSSKTDASLLSMTTHSTRRNSHQPFRRPAVVFQPNLLAGINLIADAVKPTLGPLPRFVGVEANMRDRAPELLDDAGTIGRRIVQIGDPVADVGAMMMRHALWRMREQCGDGSATTAVIAQALLQQAAKAVAAGAHPAQLRAGIERGIEQAASAINQQAIRLPGGKRGRDLLTALAKTLCHDDELSSVLVEIVDIAGADGSIQVVNNDGRRIDREYVEGAMWESPWLTTGFATDALQTIARIQDAAVVVLDGKLDTAANMVEGLRRLHALGHTRLAIIAGEITDEAKGIIIQARLSNMFQIVPIKAPGYDVKRAVAMQDIAALTGAQVLFGDGKGFADVAVSDVGAVRRAWATAKQFGLIGGQRDPAALRQSIAAVRTRIEETANLDDITELRARLGRLCGGIAIVRVGAVTSKVQEARKDEAIRLSRALQMAVRGGLVAGGGAALFTAANALKGGEGDIAWGMRCVARSLEAPLATIAENAGYDGREVVADVRSARRAAPQTPYGFDVRRGEVANMIEAGILDSAEVTERAVRVAGSLAAMTITTDVVVHHRKPQVSTNP
jgi:chaperonin GroEL